MQFERELTPDEQDELAAAFADGMVAIDEKQALLDWFGEDDEIKRETFEKRLSQKINVGALAEGEIRTMSDGTQYQVTTKGWRKIK